MKDEKIYPSIEQDEAFVGAFEYLNEELFEDTLPVPMLVLTRNPKILAGHFAPNAWTADDGSLQHEIAINANMYANGDWKEAMLTLFHEMLHMKQYDDKTAGREGYHNKEFCKFLKDAGVQALDGRTHEKVECGDGLTDELIPGGKLETILKEMPLEYVFPYLPKEMADNTKVVVISKDGEPPPEPRTPPKRGVKIKYSCAVCGQNVWGKSGMVIKCEGDNGSWHDPRIMVEQA